MDLVIPLIKVRILRIKKPLTFKLETFNNKRLSHLLKLGTLGLDLEELSVGIERKYEEMLVILRNNIQTIRSYFLERLDNVQKEFNEKIMNEKH